MVIDATSMKSIAEVPTCPKPSSLDYSSKEKVVYIISEETGKVSVVDAAIHQVVQVGDVESEPDQISFTESLAYIRHRNSELVLMIPLDGIGNEGKPIPERISLGGS